MMDEVAGRVSASPHPDPDGREPPSRVLLYSPHAGRRVWARNALRTRSDVREASTKRAALEYLAAMPADLVIAALGRDMAVARNFVKAVRTCEGGLGVPVLVLTLADRAEFRLRMLEAGANECLLYPVEARELALRVETHVTMARERRELARYRSFLERVLKHVNDVLVVLDEQWRYVYVNERMRQIAGMDEDSLLGRSIWETFPDLRGSAFESAAYEALARSEVRHCELDYAPWDRLFDVRIYPTAEGLTVFASDITEQRRTRVELEQRVEERTRELVEANRQLAAYAERARETSRRVQEAQENERRQIAHYMHDELGQELAALRLQIAAADERRQELDTAAVLDGFDEIIETVRHLSRELRPSILDNVGLAAAVSWQAREQASANEVHCDVDVEHAGARCGESVEITCYRIAHEAISNAVRHSGCATLTVRLARNGDALELRVGDDGAGFDVDREEGAGASVGLVGMRERATLIDGEVGVTSHPGKGTVVHARLPARPPQRASPGDIDGNDR